MSFLFCHHHHITELYLLHSPFSIAVVFNERYSEGGITQTYRVSSLKYCFVNFVLFDFLRNTLAHLKTQHENCALVPLRETAFSTPGLTTYDTRLTTYTFLYLLGYNYTFGGYKYTFSGYNYTSLYLTIKHIKQAPKAFRHIEK